MTKQTKDGLELELSSYALYPPYTSDHVARVHITTQAPVGSAVALDYTVNGQGGKFRGLSLHTEATGGTLTLHREFMAFYEGAWPVDIVVTATLDGLEESATLTLYDTRQMQAASVEVVLNPSDVVQIPQAGGSARAVVNSTFHDSSGVVLPYDEIAWQCVLNPPVAGVELRDRTINVSSMPHANKVQIEVSGPDGVTGNVTLTLVK